MVLADGGVRVSRRVLDVSHLPYTAFGSRAPIWWGTVGLIAIEGTMFAMLVATYFYLRMLAPAWPPADTAKPDVLRATLNVVLLVLSLPLNVLVSAVSARKARLPTLVVLGLLTLITVVSLVLRGFEFADLNCRWDAHAYGSLLWTILAMHTAHLVASVIEDALLVLVFWIGIFEDKHFVDVGVNSVYWYFVVGAWVPLYVLVFLVPQLR